MCVCINLFIKYECWCLLFDKNKSYGIKEKEYKLKYFIVLFKEMKIG